jgi:hypothetical protein
VVFPERAGFRDSQEFPALADFQERADSAVLADLAASLDFQVSAEFQDFRAIAARLAFRALAVIPD